MPGPCTPEQVPSDADVSLAVCATLRHGGSAWVEDGGTLCTGDDLWLSARAVRPMHMYVVLKKDGRGTLLAPNRVAGSPVLEEHTDHLVPDDHRVQLEGTPGALTLYVVASDDPIEHIDHGVFGALHALEVTGSTEPATSDTRPPSCTETTQSCQRGAQHETTHATTTAVSMSGGVALAVFAFEHRQ